MVEPLKRRNSQSVPAFETDTKLDRNINMRKLKVFYFFTEESDSYEEIMKTFLMNAKLEIKFSKEVINHATLASGSSFPLQDFSKHVDDVKCQITTQNVFCFGTRASEGEIFQVKVKFGIKRDRKVVMEEGMSLFKKDNIYFPGKEYYSSDPLPGDWIGLITDKTVLDKSFENEDTQAKD